MDGWMNRSKSLLYIAICVTVSPAQWVLPQVKRFAQLYHALCFFGYLVYGSVIMTDRQSQQIDRRPSVKKSVRATRTACEYLGESVVSEWRKCTEKCDNARRWTKKWMFRAQPSCHGMQEIFFHSANIPMYSDVWVLFVFIDHCGHVALGIFFLCAESILDKKAFMVVRRRNARHVWRVESWLCKCVSKLIFPKNIVMVGNLQMRARDLCVCCGLYDASWGFRIFNLVWTLADLEYLPCARIVSIFCLLFLGNHLGGCLISQ